ncbi:PH domain-containing protein [Metabacillus sp. JX24]|uniref:PH domain-containing protein n=1 Tax=Metabacillus sp. JX24 TaxID=3240759 RepID=UPI00350FAC4A
MYYPSKRDIWMSVILLLFSFLFIVPPIFFPDFGAWMTPESLDKQWIKIACLFPIGFLCLWIWFKTGYTLTENLLIVQSGPFRQKIKIDEIHSFRDTKNPFTAPALSKDRLEINYATYNSIQISPKHKQEFVNHLRKKNGKI